MTAEEMALQRSLQKLAAQSGRGNGPGDNLPVSKMIKEVRKTIDVETLYRIDIHARAEEGHAGAEEMDQAA